MKVVAFNGSGRKDGNTAMLIAEAFKPLEAAGIETEMIQLAGGKAIRGCTACYKCVENQDKRCVVGNDIVNECIEKMIEADGIILASPTYFADISAELKALIDRAGLVMRVNDNQLSRKVGAGIVAVRRAGAIHAYDSINHFFLISQMIVPGSSYWNIGVGRNIGDVQQDDEGLQTMTDLGENMAWLLGKLNS
ncbi:MAG: flavodoxin family protein [Phycisphaerales bacterium]|jgi:multimeric flavodoxin WrbA|nr:flavodoxin family protein [Phycisphaerales bacterium]